jgi:phage head maturation protease
MGKEQQQHSRTPDPNSNNQGTRSMGQIMGRKDETQENSRKRTISFSSEEPYRRYFGMEILNHSEGAVNLERLNSVGVLLFNHDTDRVVGRVLRAWLENQRGMAEVEFDTDEDAEKIFSKVKSGTLKTTSVRYSVDSWEEVRAGATSADGKYKGPCQVARKWTPLEVSIVSVPADATVGVGRADTGEETADLSVYERQIQINQNNLGGSKV